MPHGPLGCPLPSQADVPLQALGGRCAHWVQKVRPGPKFCHVLTAPEPESECITEPGPGTAAPSSSSGPWLLARRAPEARTSARRRGGPVAPIRERRNPAGPSRPRPLRLLQNFAHADAAPASSRVSAEELSARARAPPPRPVPAQGKFSAPGPRAGAPRFPAPPAPYPQRRGLPAWAGGAGPRAAAAPSPGCGRGQLSGRCICLLPRADSAAAPPCAPGPPPLLPGGRRPHACPSALRACPSFP